ncbi:MAG: hypothetical protein IJB73_04220 [Firmicutes bacterium]|nr:hypothetical protein [Bacillota bacterium]MBQ6899870.1 hypothetical protein [Bacillota bacterium]
MKCSQCNNELMIVDGRPVKDGEKAYWRQLYVCNNPNCNSYKKEVGERLINIFDESEIIEKQNLSS